MNVLRVLVVIVIAATGIINVGCGQAANSNTAANNANKPTANADIAANSTTNAEPADAETKTETASSGSMATPTDAYKFAYNCRKRKDIECLKKVMSKDVIQFFTEIGKEDKKSADDMLKELVEKPQAVTVESRNEKIEGDYASIEYKDETGAWKTMDFEKVGSDWKMGFPKKPEGSTKKP